jgi:hypothetical protein
MCNAEICHHKFNDAKDVDMVRQYFCQNFSPFCRLQPWHFAPYFGTFLPNVAATDNIKDYLHKGCSALHQKMLVKLTIGSFIGQV